MVVKTESCNHTNPDTAFLIFQHNELIPWDNYNRLKDCSLPLPPPLRVEEQSYIFIILHNNGKYYARKMWLQVNRGNFWELFVSIDDFKKLFFFWKFYCSSTRPRGEKSLRSESVCFLILDNFCFSTFFWGALFGK